MVRKIDHPITTTLTLLFFAALVLVPTLLKNEPLRWRAAWAIEQYAEGNRDVAIESLQQVALKLPDDQFVQTKLVRLLSENGQAKKAIEHCKQQLEEHPGSMDWLHLKRESECEAGDFEAAWQTFKELKKHERQHVSKTPNELNAQAYFRALAGVDLPIAATEIQQAIAQATNQPRTPRFQLPLHSRALVAASLLSRHTKTQNKILPLLSQRIEFARRLLEEHEGSVVKSIIRLSGKGFPLAKNGEFSLEDGRVKIEFRRRELAFLMTTRAILFEDLGEPDRCDFDRAQVVDLGFEPQSVADLLPDDTDCHLMAMQSIAFLDTRGFVLTQMPWTDPDELFDGVSTGRDAISDLKVAVAVSEAYYDLLQDTNEVPDATIAQARKTFAAVLHHHSMVMQKAGDQESVQHDRDRIESLGYDADGVFY